jgi:hypothetical protein
MTVTQLAAVRDAARSVAGRPGAHRLHDFLWQRAGRRSLVPLGCAAWGQGHPVAVTWPFLPVEEGGYFDHFWQAVVSVDWAAVTFAVVRAFTPDS